MTDDVTGAPPIACSQPHYPWQDAERWRNAWSAQNPEARYQVQRCPEAPPSSAPPHHVRCVWDGHSDKWPYATRDEAEQAIATLESSGTAKFPLEPYACRTCRQWHLGRTRENAATSRRRGR